jgi:acetyl-CoA carboxylase biotin carboxyl carrier protein
VTGEREGSSADPVGPASEHGGARPGHVDAILADVIPALAARLRASRLAELEVRTADWRVRVRRDVGAVPAPSPSGQPGAPARRASQVSVPPSEQAGMARSPAVGYFMPSPSAEIGRSVRSGDLLGHVEVLGIHHDVPSPADGIVIRSLAVAGQAVEYGQPLVLVEAGGSIGLQGPARAAESAALAASQDLATSKDLAAPQDRAPDLDLGAV